MGGYCEQVALHTWARTQAEHKKYAKIHKVQEEKTAEMELLLSLYEDTERGDCLQVEERGFTETQPAGALPGSRTMRKEMFLVVSPLKKIHKVQLCVNTHTLKLSVYQSSIYPPIYPSIHLQSIYFFMFIYHLSWRRAWQPTPVFLPGEFHGQRSMAGHCP